MVPLRPIITNDHLEGCFPYGQGSYVWLGEPEGASWLGVDEMASIMRAVVGAVYREGGMEGVRRVESALDIVLKYINAQLTDTEEYCLCHRMHPMRRTKCSCGE